MKPRAVFSLGTFNAHDSERAVLAAIRQGLDVLCLQEALITDPIRALLERQGYDYAERWRGQIGLVLIWRRDLFQRYASGFAQAHDGMAKVTPTRGDLYAYLRHRPSGDLLSVLDSHRINRWQRRWYVVPRIRARWRAACRLKHIATTRRTVRARPTAVDWTGRPYYILGGGDFNDLQPPMPKGAHWLHKHRIDGLWAIGNVHVLSRRVVSGNILGSDHDLVIARVRLGSR